MKKIPFVAVLCLLSLASSGASLEKEPVEGRWLIDFDRADASRLQLTLQRRTSGHGSWNNSSRANGRPRPVRDGARRGADSVRGRRERERRLGTLSFHTGAGFSGVPQGARLFRADHRPALLHDPARRRTPVPGRPALARLRARPDRGHDLDGDPRRDSRLHPRVEKPGVRAAPR